MRELVGLMVLIACTTVPGSVRIEDGPEKLAERSGQSVEAELEQLVANKECGSHALYLMLRLRNYDISHDAFRDAVHVGDDGSSLADLQLAARKVGVETGIYRCDLTELMKQCERPVVVLIHNLGVGMIEHALARSRVEVGHYVTLLGKDETTGFIVGIDGSDGRVREFSDSRFLDVWTGYVLLPHQLSWWAKWKWIIVGNIACWSVLILYLSSSMRRTRINGSLSIKSAIS